MTVRMRHAAATTLLALAAAPGCSSKWFRQGESVYIVRTDVVVRTQPTAADVTFNGVRMAQAPVKIPVEYDHVAERYVRQSNYGVAIRESTGVVGTILLFPVWLPASIIQFREEMTRYVYGNNRHTVGASLPGRQDASQEITLEGQAEFPVELRLAEPPR